MSVYCIVKAMKCTVGTNRVNSFVLQPRHVQNDCIFFSFSDVNLFLLTCFTLLESDLRVWSSLRVCSKGTWQIIQFTSGHLDTAVT